MNGDPAAPAPEERGSAGRAERMAEAVRLVITSRERAPRPPRLEHAFKRLIWRYNRECARKTADKEESTDVTK
jgi:hypothetical protein